MEREPKKIDIESLQSFWEALGVTGDIKQKVRLVANALSQCTCEEEVAEVMAFVEARLKRPLQGGFMRIDFWKELAKQEAMDRITHHDSPYVRECAEIASITGNGTDAILGEN